MQWLSIDCALPVQKENDDNDWKLMAAELLKLTGSVRPPRELHWDEDEGATCPHCGSASSWQDEDEGGGCHCGDGECCSLTPV